jgi:hypothetical protein
VNRTVKKINDGRLLATSNVVVPFSYNEYSLGVSEYTCFDISGVTGFLTSWINSCSLNSND